MSGAVDRLHARLVRQRPLVACVAVTRAILALAILWRGLRRPPAEP